MSKRNLIFVKNGGIFENFVKVEHSILEDKRLSGNAFKLMCYLISKQEGWKFNVKDITSRLGFGADAYRSARSQLYKYGYIEYEVNSYGTQFTCYRRPDQNSKYINGINEHEERTVELSPLLQEFIEQKKEKGLSTGEQKRPKNKTRIPKNIIPQEGDYTSENRKLSGDDDWL